MVPCVSQATTLPSAFADDVENYAAAGCRTVEVWLTKLEQHLETVSAENTRLALQQKDVTLAAAAYQGGLLLSQGEHRRAHFEHFKRRLDLCQFFGVRTLVLAADFAQKPDPQALGRAVASLAQAGQWATGFGVRLALEFRGGDAFCSSLDTAVTLVEQCREPNVGVCLDAFHYYKGPSKSEDLERLSAANLFHVQVCDVAGVPREVMTDSDRVLPGDGEFRLAPIVARLRAIGYDGAVSLELMDPVLWQTNPQQVVSLGLQAVERVLATK